MTILSPSLPVAPSHDGGGAPAGQPVSACLAQCERAARRAQGTRSLLAARRAHLGQRLQQIAVAAPCGDAGTRYVLAQNVGTAERPLWTFLSVGDAATGQLVFSGNRQPLELSAAEAMELAPALSLFSAEVVLTLAPPPFANAGA